MIASFLDEPELDFADGQHIDARFGIANYGPADLRTREGPLDIRLGLVGTTETIEGVQSWLEKCRMAIEAKASRQPHLFPHFPGFAKESPFEAELLFDSTQRAVISTRDLKHGDDASRDAMVVHAVDAFTEGVQHLVDSRNVDVIVCALPSVVLEHLADASDAGGKGPRALDHGPDFHDLLKARTLHLRRPLQLVLPSTYGKPGARRRSREHPAGQLQDEATRAWNLHTALYYKAGGTPWRLVRRASDLTTCYVGISFYRSRDQQTLQTSMAQVFNERGEGVIVRGGAACESKDDRQPHLDHDDAHALLTKGLKLYRQEHRTLPARVVVHKTSSYSAQEVSGLSEAADDLGVDSADLIHVSNSSVRLFRKGMYPPLRGTHLQLDDSHHLLYTRGSVDFFRTYPGMYVPVPLIVEIEHAEQTWRTLVAELLALTKMNWNNTQFDGRLPITLRAARDVGRVLKYVGDDSDIAPRYANYM